jgi:hypothetical protein
MRKMVTEHQLETYLRCPLSAGWVELAFTDTCMSAVRRLIDRAAQEPGKVDTPYVREYLAGAWSNYADGSKEYITGHKKIWMIAKRVADVLRDYEIVVPTVGYSLALDQSSLACAYAVARPWRKDAPWLCVSLRRSKAPQYYRSPT